MHSNKPSICQKKWISRKQALRRIIVSIAPSSNANESVKSEPFPVYWMKCWRKRCPGYQQRMQSAFVAVSSPSWQSPQDTPPYPKRLFTHIMNTQHWRPPPYSLVMHRHKNAPTPCGDIGWRVEPRRLWCSSLTARGLRTSEQKLFLKYIMNSLLDNPRDVVFSPTHSQRVYQ